MIKPSKTNLTRFTEEQIDNEIDFICGCSDAFFEIPEVVEIAKKHGYSVSGWFAYIDLDAETRHEIKETLFYTGVYEPFVIED